ncbi:MAG: DHH family phosphoesterase, partial [Bacilli bacterium]
MTPDVDGYTSSALLYMFLVNECNHDKKKIKIFIHENKEHGLGDEKVFKAIKKSCVDFMIIADASTNDTKEIKELMKMNKRILLLDHHNLEDDNMKTKYQNQKGELIGVIVNNQINEYSTCLSG